MEAITVSKLSSYIKQIFDNEELLHNIPVMGEIFGVNLTRNIVYFFLKDEYSTLPCVCFYPNFADQIVEGKKVIVVGSPTYYAKGGKLNFNVVNIEQVGQGQLYEDFLKLKEQLDKEGLFDLQHKKEIPQNIKRVGVITSKEGAVLQDIKNVAWRRNPNLDIVLFDTKVQGQGAEKEIARAIEKLGVYDKIDVIIVARGGGSLEDLSAFNTEIVARATYNCPKPIISAVGHETDYTIIDFVSDLRAPTPSAAAELITFNLSEKKETLINYSNSFVKATNRWLQQKQDQLENFTYILTTLFEKQLLNKETYLQRLKTKFLSNSEMFLNEKYFQISLIENTLQKINPADIIKKGYVKIEQEGKAKNSIDMINLNEEIEIIFKDGRLKALPSKKEYSDEIK